MTEQNHRMVTLGGVSFIAAAVAFTLVFGYLAANFDYPDILDGSAADVLPRLRDGGAEMRAVWAIYACLPLLLIPGAAGTFLAFPSRRAQMTPALVFASIAALSMCLGLMRWPSVHWVLAEAYPVSPPEARLALDAVFRGLNLYLGNYIGEFLGETTLAAFFLLSGMAMAGEDGWSRRLGLTGVGFSVLFVIGAFRNVTGAVQIVADVNNGLLPIWLIVLGIVLIRRSSRLNGAGTAS